MSLPPSSLIIPTRERPNIVYDTVMSILDGNEIPDEIVIIDQSKVAHPILSNFQPNQECEVRYLHSDVVGAPQARNIGLDNAKNDLIVILDDDVFVEKTWFGTMVRALFHAGPRVVVAGRILPTTSSVPGGFVPTTKEDPTPAIYIGRITEDVFITANVALFRSAFNEIGYFDIRLGPGTAFHSADDNDFGFRLLEAGYQIHYVPEAIIYHRAWRAARDYLPMRWKYGYGQGAFYAKYFSLKDRFMIGRMWADLSRHAGRVLRYGFMRSIKQISADIVYSAALLCGATTWLLTQRKMQ